MGILIDSVSAARENLSNCNKVESFHSTAVGQHEAAVARARKNGFKTLPAREIELAAARCALSDASEAKSKAKELVEAAEKALAAAREARYQEREHEARVLLGVHASGEMVLKRDERGYRGEFAASRWEVSLLQLDELGRAVIKTYTRDGETFSYAEPRFGYEATVYGPEKDYRGKLTGATINWGTLGAVSCGDAADLIRVHSAALKLATWLNQQREAWDAQDLAD